MWLMTLRIALRALRRNKLRSFLTMLGIIIGVGAVIAMVAIGEGAKALVRAQIASLGTNVIVIAPGSSVQRRAKRIRRSSYPGRRRCPRDRRRNPRGLLYFPLAQGLTAGDRRQSELGNGGPGRVAGVSKHP